MREGQKNESLKKFENESLKKFENENNVMAEGA